MDCCLAKYNTQQQRKVRRLKTHYFPFSYQFPPENNSEQRHEAQNIIIHAAWSEIWWCCETMMRCEKDEFLNISITSGTTKIQQTQSPTQRCSVQLQSDLCSFSLSLSFDRLKMINSTQFWSQPTCWLNRDDGKVQEQQRLLLTLVPAVDFHCVFFYPITNDLGLSGFRFVQA